MSRPPVLVLLPALLVVLAVVLGLLAWHHMIPGGWFLRDLIEDPDLREERLRLQHREERLLAFQEEAVSSLAERVVFLGSSTIEHFPLERFFAAGRTLNRGIGEERAEELLMRLGQTLPPRPAGFVLYVGAVDVHGDRRPPDFVARRLAAVLRYLRATSPEAPCLVLGILPPRAPTREELSRLHAVNLALALTARRSGATFLHTGKPPITDSRGGLSPSLSRDRHHLNEAGYAALARLILDADSPLSALLQPR